MQRLSSLKTFLANSTIYTIHRHNQKITSILALSQPRARQCRGGYPRSLAHIYPRVLYVKCHTLNSLSLFLPSFLSPFPAHSKARGCSSCYQTCPAYVRSHESRSFCLPSPPPSREICIMQTHNASSSSSGWAQKYSPSAAWPINECSMSAGQYFCARSLDTLSARHTANVRARLTHPSLPRAAPARGCSAAAAAAATLFFLLLSLRAPAVAPSLIPSHSLARAALFVSYAARSFYSSARVHIAM